MNGIAVELTASEAAKVATVPGVAAVRQARVEHIDTYRGPTFIGAEKVWDGTSTPSGVGTMGEGIVVADLDNGAYSTHHSFANDPACGLSGANPKLIQLDC